MSKPGSIKSPPGFPSGSMVNAEIFALLLPKIDELALRAGTSRFGVLNAALAAGLAIYAATVPKESPS
jgi:hypothetical protein